MSVYRLGVLTFLLLASLASAACQTADLSGYVRDRSDAVIAHASVTIINESTRRKQAALSNSDGLYRFAFLVPGLYTISVQAAGFDFASRSAVKLDPGQQARLSFTLVPAHVEESITVSAITTFIPSESPTVGTNLDPQFVQNLPLNGRTFQALISLVPGVVLTTNTAGNDSRGQFSVNGQRDTSNYVTVDGVSANVGMSSDPLFAGSTAGGAIPAFNVFGGTQNLVSVEGMQEFKLQTATDLAASGRGAGGHLEVVTRSGSNNFHGSAFEYLRNEAFDANDWFANHYHTPMAPHRQNDFGGTFGGPILKDRTFFFFCYEGLRLQLPSEEITTVPSVSVRQSATGAIAQLLNAYPLPTGPNIGATRLAPFVASVSSRLSSDNASMRVDYTASKNLAVFGRYSEAPSDSISPELSSDTIYRNNFRSLTLGTTFAPSPKVTNDFRLNYSRTQASGYTALTNFGGAIPPPTSLVFPAPFASSSSSSFSVHGLAPQGIVAGRSAENLQRQTNVVSSTSMVKGSHEVRFGFDYRRLTPHYGTHNYNQAVFFTGIPQALNGIASRVRIASADAVSVVFHNLSVYSQDTWKVTPTLTITYGLRWELCPPPYGLGDQKLFTLTGFPDLANVELAPSGTPVYKTSYTNFAPHAGVAYQLSSRPGKETILRGGFGIFYDLGVGNIGSSAQSFPHNHGTLSLKVPYPLSSRSAAPPPPLSLNPPYSATFNVFGPGHELPRSFQWSLTIDQKLSTDQSVSASYVGEAGRKLLREHELLDPNPRFNGSAIDFTTNDSLSDYHALQVQYRRSVSHGLAALLSYTWSHSTDNLSLDEAATLLFDPHLDHGASDFDVRHAFNAAVTYNIPSGSVNPALGAIIKDWSLDMIFSARAAMPVDVTVYRGDVATDVLFRPDIVPGVPVYLRDSTAPGQRRINPAAFSVPLDVRQGNLPRNAFRGFGLLQTDIDIRRQFSLTEALKLQWRADFFNMFNRANFAGVDGLLGYWGPPLQPEPTFGMATFTAANGHDLIPLFSGGGPRSIQLSLQLRF